VSNLRIIGLIVGIFGLLLTFRIYRGPKWKRLNFIFFGLFSVFLIVISINPNLLNVVAGMLALQRQQRGRILALLIYSNIFLWFLVLYLKSRLDDYKHQFDFLVRNLGHEEIKPILKNTAKDKEIMIIIPAYNEEKSLGEFLKHIPSAIEGKKVSVVVVDDGSIDKTAQIAKEAGCLVARNKTRRGGGAALRLGYDIAKNVNSRIVVTMDADGQHSPREIKRLVEPILRDKYDLVIGSRLLGEWDKDNRFRFVGLHAFNFVINLLLRTKITDCSSGFRAFKCDLLKALTLKEDQFHTSELIIDAIKKNARIGEVPISVSKRKHGKSKKGKDWKYGLNFAKTIIKTWWR